jgi:serine/threonine protein kinase
MVAKRPPFKSNSMKELYKKVTSAKYSPVKIIPSVPYELYHLIKIILQPNPKQRPSCNTLLN